jgi:hypothetical protein
VSIRKADLVSPADRLQVGAHPRLVGDDPGVLGVGLPISAVGGCGMVHDPAGDIEQPLPVTGEQCDQQRRAAGVEIGGPADLVAVAEIDHGGD